jgi:O-antigen biosynthesis protein
MNNLLRRLLGRVRGPTHARPANGTNGPGWATSKLQTTMSRHVGALRSLLKGDTTLFGECPVCGEATMFVGELGIARESLQCAVCLTTSRYRGIALGLLDVIEQRTGRRLPSLRALAGQRLGKRLRVYDTQLPFYFGTCAYPLPDMLAACPDIEVRASRFRPQDPLGSPIDTRPFASNQNLERLTFADASFDVVVTSDVMEHVRRDDLAHAEIRRVLAPGGTYLFTVPHTRGQRDTIHRVKVHDPADPARDEFVLPKEYHGDANDPDNAALSYRVYGTEIDEALQRLGFRVDYRRTDRPAQGVLSTELFACTVASA